MYVTIYVYVSFQGFFGIEITYRSESATIGRVVDNILLRHVLALCIALVLAHWDFQCQRGTGSQYKNAVSPFV